MPAMDEIESFRSVSNCFLLQLRPHAADESLRHHLLLVILILGISAQSQSKCYCANEVFHSTPHSKPKVCPCPK
uniref:Uncharacterized protein n=1 Tax=uncultured marine virus TaxID=186617 RepID=A0A0F7L2M7_9VIRU|nr:hypothetical protein [uncultured marine virus]